MSGVLIEDRCKTDYDKLKRNPHKYQYIIMEMSEDYKQVKVFETKEREEREAYSDMATGLATEKADYDTFLDMLAERKCPEKKKPIPSYVVYDFRCWNKENQMREKPILISWCPDGAMVKKKMIHASSWSSVKKALAPEVYKEVNDKDDMSFEALAEIVGK